MRYQLDWRFTFSYPGYHLYEADYHGARCFLHTDGVGRQSFTRLIGARQHRYETEAELLDSFPRIAEGTHAEQEKEAQAQDPGPQLREAR